MNLEDHNCAAFNAGHHVPALARVIEVFRAWLGVSDVRLGGADVAERIFLGAVPGNLGSQGPALRIIGVRLEHVAQRVSHTANEDIVADEGSGEIELRTIGIRHPAQDSPEPVRVGCNCAGAVA